MQRENVNRLSLSTKALFRDPTSTLLLVLLGVLASFMVSATPRFMNQMSDDALDNAAFEASPQQRNISFIRFGRISGQPAEPYGSVRDAGNVLEGEIEGQLGEATEPSATMIDSTRFRVQDLPVDPGVRVDRWFTFRGIDGAEGEVSLLRGSLPVPADPLEVVVMECDSGSAEEDPPPPEAECGPVTLPRFETAVTAQTADQLRMDIGDRVYLVAEIDSRHNRGLPRSGIDFEFVLELSGIVELSPPDNDIWMGDRSLHQAVRTPVGFTEFDTFATGLLAPDDYLRLLDEVLPSRFRYAWNNTIDYELIDSSNIDEVEAEHTRLELLHQGADAFARPQMISGLDRIIDTYRQERQIAITMTALILVGLLGTLLGVLAVSAALAAKRRERSVVLIRARGEETMALITRAFFEGVAVFLPAVIGGIFLADLAVDGRPGDATLVVAGSLVVGLAVLNASASLPTTAGDLGRLLANARPKRSDVFAVFVQLAVVTAAVAAVLIFRRRGLAEDSVDLLMASVPLLVAFAAGVVLLRLQAPLSRAAGAVASKRRGVVGLLGLRAMARRSLASQLLTVVVVIGITTAAFGLTFTHTVGDTQEAGSWQEVGANYRLEPFNPIGTISPQLDVSNVAGVSEIAQAVIHDAGLGEQGVARGNISVLAVDVDNYQAVGAGTPAEPGLGARLEPDTLIDSGTESNPIPVVASMAWAEKGIRVGEILTLIIDHRPVVVVVDEIREAFPGLPLGRDFAVMSRKALAASSGNIPTQANRLFVRAPDTSSDALAAAVTDQQPGLRLVSRPDLLEDVQTRPSVTAIATITLLTIGAALLLAAVVTLIGFSLTSSERNRQMGYLRAIGLSPSQVSKATFLEQVPTASGATLVGVAVGLGLWILVAPFIDLTPITATELDVETSVPWVQIAGLAAAMLGTVLGSGAIYSYLNRNTDLAGVLRRGDRT